MSSESTPQCAIDVALSKSAGAATMQHRRFEITESSTMRPTKRRGRRLATVLIIAGAVGGGTVVPVTPAFADYSSGGVSTRSWNVKPVGINNTWISYLDTGCSRWNNAGVGSNLARASSAADTYTAASYPGQSWYGRYEPSGYRGINRTFSIMINVTPLVADAGNNLAAWSLSTTTHELGHGLSLADNPNTPLSSLMKHDRDRTTSGSPTGYDVSEVLRIYS